MGIAPHHGDRALKTRELSGTGFPAPGPFELAELGWREIAQIMLRDGETPEDEDLEKEAGRLRKRYQLAKDKLRQMAVEQGLVGGEEG